MKFGKILLTMQHPSYPGEYAEIDENGFTRFIDSNHCEIPMRSMDNFNTRFAKHYLQYRGWIVTEVRP